MTRFMRGRTKIMELATSGQHLTFFLSIFSSYTFQFEVAVIDFFASLWKMEKDSYWGYITTSGTEVSIASCRLSCDFIFFSLSNFLTSYYVHLFTKKGKPPRHFVGTGMSS